MKMRRMLGITLALLVVSLGAAACDVRVAGRRCPVNGATAQDATHLLVCTNGRWAKSATKVQIAYALLAAIQAQTPRDIAAGNGHSCSTMENGEVKCWGFNSSGQLGDGTTTNSVKPVKVAGVTGASSAQLGAEFGCVIEPTLPAPVGTSPRDCWGFNGFGQIGDGSTTNRPTSVRSGTGYNSVATGTVHTCLSSTVSGITCFGQNAAGQLGNGSTTASSNPVAVSGLTGTTGALAAGGSHSCALVAGAITCWGGNGSGQLGDGTTTQRLTPVPVVLNSVYAIDAGGEETCAMIADRTAACWGANAAGQLGDGTTTNRPDPTVVTGLTNIDSISVGQDHACAVIVGGTVKCWGSNANGQLGNGTTTSSSTPIAVPGVTGATRVTAGFGHTCAVADKQVWCWGRNDFGQLGDGTTTERHSPVKVVWG